MIVFDRVTVTYDGAERPTLRDVRLRVPPGELWVVAGLTGSGKSTLLRCVNGLVPRFTGGRLSGSVLVDGRSTADHPPRELAATVGMVGQDPVAGFVTTTVEEELAYGMEQLGLPAATMRTRVEETLDLLGIADLRNRPLHDLSGGQQQRVAIGSVLTAHPSVLVLDEPTSALDPTAAEEVLATITRLVHDVGTTVLMAEHRLERVVHAADALVVVDGDGSVRSGPPAEMLVDAPVAPPLVELGRLARWSPLPLSVRDARRMAGPLRERLSIRTAPEPAPEPPTDRTTPRPQANRALHASGIRVTYPGVVAVHDVDLDLHRGEVVGLMGRNGSGKSSLLWALQGSGPRARGAVVVAGPDPHALGPARRRALVGLVPQSAGDLVYLDRVDAECDQADRDGGADAGTARAILEQLTGDRIDPSSHPRDLSEGQLLALVLAVQLAAAPPVVLLDEPTRGLDYPGKEALAAMLRTLADDGRAVVVASHDVEFVGTSCDRVVVMAQGEIVADDATATVLASSPMFATQVAKVLAPLPVVTVGDVIRALRQDDR